MSSNNNSNQTKSGSEVLDIEQEIQHIADKRKQQNQRKLQKTKKTHSLINVAILSLCAVGFFLLKDNVFNRNVEAVTSPTMNVVSFTDVNQCLSFAATNSKFKNVDCKRMESYAKEKSAEMGGGWMMLNGQEGKRCYNSPESQGFAVVKQPSGDKSFSIPLYYIKHIDINMPGLYFPSGHRATLNKEDVRTMQNIAIFNKRATICQ
ncbi:hypothetical protein LMH73_023245 [Vibrio splendidus]|nr:hypothetical protein [Vibrio splendidus]MCC4881535.1 hypothetical protein [Vibrio splendidus]